MSSSNIPTNTPSDFPTDSSRISVQPTVTIVETADPTQLLEPNDGGSYPTTSPIHSFIPPETWWIKGSCTLWGDHNRVAAGSSVALNDNGTVMAVGMPGYVWNGVNHTGLVRVFWFLERTQKWLPFGCDIVGAGGFGASVALSSDGKTLVVGSPNAKQRQGFAATFQYIGNAWQPLGASIIHGLEQDDNCGFPWTFHQTEKPLPLVARVFPWV